MPCHDGREAQVNPSAWTEPLREDIARLTKKVHQLTAMLCGACADLERLEAGLVDYHMYEMHPELRVWWIDHQVQDRLRTMQEEVKLAKEIAGLSSEAKEWLRKNGGLTE